MHLFHPAFSVLFNQSLRQNHFSLLIQKRVKVLIIQSCLTPLSMELTRQEYCSELSFPSPGDLSHPGIKPVSPALQGESLPSEPPGGPP